ncbi:MAG TPA: glycosyltransferase family 4 protein [Actinomycetota bacterium]|nr:glycosyltransferase family 4 protein [Actinomycetota bacterium]
MKVAVYNRFLQSMGGGERHSGMLAQVLADDGHEVDLVGHEDVGKEILADHLGLNLGKVTLRIVPDRGEESVARLSAEYELFVNASYMSRVRAQAARSLYLCYFPTPADHDLAGWQRRLARLFRRYVREGQPGVGWNLGWFPPDRGRRRTSAWTSGTAGLQLPAGHAMRVVFDLGRPGAPGPAEVTVTHEGAELARLQASPDRFQRHQLALPASEHDREVVFQSDTFVPGGADDRTLGVAVSRLRMAGARWEPRRWAGERFPWLLRDPTGLGFLDRYERVLANSEYTREWVRRLWGVEADVLFPPIRVQELRPGPKQRRILTVGRFIARGLGHSKKQLELVEAFAAMVRRGGMDGWELQVVGGCEPSQRRYLAEVQRAAEGLPVHVHANAPRSLVEELFASSSIFWVATGLGEDEEKAPWLFEHFGITTVEAMAAGCVPVVIDKAGQREIVRHGTDGYRWTTLGELEALTRKLAVDDGVRERLAAAAVERAGDFSEAAFAARWRQIAASLGLR